MRYPPAVSHQVEVVNVDQYVPLTSLSKYWHWMNLLRTGRLPEARKIGGRWFLPVALVTEDGHAGRG
jgi:hypothetical protein